MRRHSAIVGVSGSGWWRAPLASLRAMRARWRATRSGSLVGMGSSEGIPWRVAAVYPHDPLAFTQGLTWHEGRLFESTGLRGSSTLREVDLESGRLLRVCRLPRHQFGEGIAVVRRRIVQLTWQSGVARVYEVASFRLLDEVPIEGEGWGLTRLEGRLLMSDGSATLRWLEADTLEVLDSLDVREDGRPLRGLNDLEAVDGTLWANVFPEKHLVAVDLESGRVVGRCNVAELCTLPENIGAGNVLNGVCWRSDTGRLLVTGKRWPRLFELEVGA